jgi:hypothetical protein
MLEHTHSFGEWAVTTPATCKDAGVKTRTCACGESETEAIPATNEHTWGAWVETKAPTTEAKGEETRTCSVCEKTETRETAKLEHTCEHEWSNWVTITAPTEDANGTEMRACQKCGETETREVTPSEPGEQPSEQPATDRGCGAPSADTAAVIMMAAALVFVFKKRLFAR